MQSDDEMNPYRHQEFQFKLLEALHYGTESKHLVSKGNLIGLLSLFLYPFYANIGT